MARFQAGLERRGRGCWAVEIAATGGFIGLAGLDPVEEGTPLPGVEAGRRPARPDWGHGCAAEAARAAVAHAFEDLAPAEVLAVTAAGGLRSRAVTDRLGMTYGPADDFDDPEVPEGPLRRSVVYLLRAGDRRPGGRWPGPAVGARDRAARAGRSGPPAGRPGRSSAGPLARGAAHRLRDRWAASSRGRVPYGGGRVGRRISPGR